MRNFHEVATAEKDALLYILGGDLYSGCTCLGL